MYSKFGRQTADRFQILRQREEILRGKSKKLAMKRIPYSFHKNYIDPVELQDLIHIEKRVKPKKKRPKSSWSFLSQGREEGVKLSSENPPVGHYNCNYDQVSRRVSVPDMHPRPRTTSRLPNKEKQLAMNSPEKPRAHVPSPIPFEKQISRPSMHRYSPSTVLEPNFFYGKKRCVTPDLSKTLGRDPKLFDYTVSVTEYNVKYDLVTKQNPKAPKFELYSQRPPNIVKHLQGKEYDVSYKLVQRRVKSPKYKKHRKKKESPLPKHMTDCNSRISLQILNEKTLIMNNRISKSFIYYIFSCAPCAGYIFIVEG